MSTGIRLRGGPCDGETHEVKDTTRRVTRSSKYPGVSYDASDEYEELSGRRIFVYREPAEAGNAAR